MLNNPFPSKNLSQCNFYNKFQSIKAHSLDWNNFHAFKYLIIKILICPNIEKYAGFQAVLANPLQRSMKYFLYLQAFPSYAYIKKPT